MSLIRPNILSPIEGQIKPGLGSGVGSLFYDGIHLDFVRNRFYTKAPGAVPTIAPFTTIFTFTGDNKSYYRGSAGLLIPSATNTPRIEYDASGNLLGLLVEGARTNLGLHSNDLTNAAWVPSNVTTAKTSTGPDGVANSASRVTASAGNGTSLQSVTSGSATRAYSVWLKRITGTGNIDLTVDNGTTWTTKTITASWARYEITQAAVTNPIFGIRIVTSGDAIDVYGAQLESAAFGSSLIPTTTASVARAGDAPIRTYGAEVSETVGTFFAECVGPDHVGTVGGDEVIVGIDDGGTTDRIYMYRDSGGNGGIGRQLMVSNNVTQAQPANGGIAAGARFKMAMVYATNDVISALDGVLSTPDTSCALPEDEITTVRIGHRPGPAGGFFGHIRRLSYYPERKSDAWLKQVTS